MWQLMCLLTEWTMTRGQKDSDGETNRIARRKRQRERQRNKATGQENDWS